MSKKAENRPGASGTDVVEPAAEVHAEKSAVSYPAGHNGNNRRISDILRESGRGVDLLAVNRKLKMQVARLMSETGKQ